MTPKMNKIHKIFRLLLIAAGFVALQLHPGIPTKAFSMDCLTDWQMSEVLGQTGLDIVFTNGIDIDVDINFIRWEDSDGLSNQSPYNADFPNGTAAGWLVLINHKTDPTRVWTQNDGAMISLDIATATGAGFTTTGFTTTGNATVPSGRTFMAIGLDNQASGPDQRIEFNRENFDFTIKLDSVTTNPTSITQGNIGGRLHTETSRLRINSGTIYLFPH